MDQPQPGIHDNSAGTAGRNILFLAPEWGSITKVGGLADVVVSLSEALLAHGLEVRTVLLGYRHLRMKLLRKYFYPQLPFFLLEESKHPDYPEHIFYVLRHPALDAIHEPYTPSYTSNDSSLDLLQALLLALAPFAIFENPEISWKPDVVHGHDWLCGLFPYFNRFLPNLLPRLCCAPLPSLLTIHNASYMGTFTPEIAENFAQLLRQWGIAIAPGFQIDNWKFEGKINLLATGLRFAHKINTVSPTHARELLEGHDGISSILRERSPDFCGILNGVGDSSWNPSSDPYLKEYPYGSTKREVIKAKQYWRQKLAEKLQFPLSTKIPLLVSICRVVKQKGLQDLLMLDYDTGNAESSEPSGTFRVGSKPIGKGPLIESLAQNRCQLIILGEGDSQLELSLQMLAWQHPQNFMFLNYFHEEMAHILTAAADFFLMPSLYEPCGLNQIYSLRYGTTPVVRKTGGLADTIQHKVNGLVFENCSTDELQNVLNEAFQLWHRKARQLWGLKQYGMMQDFSWQKNLNDYIQLYHDCMQAASA